MKKNNFTEIMIFTNFRKSQEVVIKELCALCVYLRVLCSFVFKIEIETAKDAKYYAKSAKIDYF